MPQVECMYLNNVYCLSRNGTQLPTDDIKNIRTDLVDEV